MVNDFSSTNIDFYEELDDGGTLDMGVITKNKS
jgi:hypothetical protein